MEILGIILILAVVVTITILSIISLKSEKSQPEKSIRIEPYLILLNRKSPMVWPTGLVGKKEVICMLLNPLDNSISQVFRVRLTKELSMQSHINNHYVGEYGGYITFFFEDFEHYKRYRNTLITKSLLDKMPESYAELKDCTQIINHNILWL